MFRNYIFLIMFLVTGTVNASQDLSLTSEFNKNVLLSESGDTSAMVEVAKAYRKGLGTKKNYGKTIQYIQKSAAMGNLEAIQILARMYETGVNDTSSIYSENRLLLEPNKETVKKLNKNIFDKSLEQASSSVWANILLGNAFTTGFDGVVTPDPLKAYSYFEKAFQLAESGATQKDEKSMLELMELYEYGTAATTQNVEKAYAVLNELVKLNNFEATKLLIKVNMDFCCRPLFKYIKKDERNGSVVQSLLKNLALKGDYESQKMLANKYGSKCDEKCNKDVIYWGTMAVNQKPDDNTYEDLAVSYMAIDDYDMALASYYNALSISPHPNHYRQYSQIYSFTYILAGIEGGVTKNKKPLVNFVMNLPKDELASLKKEVKSVVEDVKFQNETYNDNNEGRQRIVDFYSIINKEGLLE